MGHREAEAPGDAPSGAVAWSGAMGAAAAARRAATLVERLRPACLAMCGICAGKRGEVALGDVIVAGRVYSFEHGKLTSAASATGEELADFAPGPAVLKLLPAGRLDVVLPFDGFDELAGRAVRCGLRTARLLR
jgi:nucleoside phosphorylase